MTDTSVVLRLDIQLIIIFTVQFDTVIIIWKLQLDWKWSIHKLKLENTEIENLPLTLTECSLRECSAFKMNRQRWHHCHTCILNSDWIFSYRYVIVNCDWSLLSCIYLDANTTYLDILLIQVAWICGCIASLSIM